MKVLLTSEMKQAEQAAITRFGIPGIKLMELAGEAVALEVQAHIHKTTKGEVVVLCGHGNNGGDGLVAARYLTDMGIPVNVVMAFAPSRCSALAKVNFNRIEELNIPWRVWDSDNLPPLLGDAADPEGPRKGVEDLVDPAECRVAAFGRADKRVPRAAGGVVVLIDALLGTGVTGEITSPYKEMIEWMNKSRRTIFSVDIPSGVSSDTGEILGSAVKAFVTITMGALKRGLILYPGRSLAGDIIIADIGLPPGLPEIINAKSETFILQDAKDLLPKRSPIVHKGECGRLLVIGGSRGMAGAPALVCMGALRAGVGLVTSAIPEETACAFHSMLPEAMSIPLPTDEKGELILSNDNLLSRLSGFHAAVIGPGLKISGEALCAFLDLFSKPVVLDAGALAVVTVELLDRNGKNNWVLTPHEGELAKILNISYLDIRKKRVALVEELSAHLPVTLVLKGAATLVGSRGNPIFINCSGNPGMATAGSGDVLSGIIGAFLAQGLSPRQAAVLGVFLHGVAGDFAAEEIGETGFLASDIAAALPKAIKRVRST